MKSTMQFLKIIGCITLLTLGTLALVNSCLSNSGLMNDLSAIAEDLKDHCIQTVTWQG